MWKEGVNDGDRCNTPAAFSALNAATQAADTPIRTTTTQASIDAADSALKKATETFTTSIFTYKWTPAENIADASWAEIEGIAELAAKSPEDYARYVGQTKTVTMNDISGVTDVTLKILGIAQDAQTNGEKAGFTAQLTHGLSSSQPESMTMNNSAFTNANWEKCLMRTQHLGKIEAALPEDLRKIIKTVTKQTSMAASGTTMTLTEDKLWLLSFKEVFGDAQGYASGGSHNWLKTEGEWYTWYREHNTNADRIINQAGGSACEWWLRSLYELGGFCHVRSGGSWDYNGASGAALPCAGLCI